MIYQGGKQQLHKLQQRSARAMQQINHPLPPTLQQFDMKLLDQTVVFTCQTNVSQSNPPGPAAPHQLLIQNYYCYQLGDLLIKVTKVRIGTELITMVDKLSLKGDTAQKSNQATIQEKARTRPSDPRSSHLLLSTRKKKLLNMFCEWMQKNQPQTKAVFDRAHGEWLSQADLKAQMRQNMELRSSLMAFKQGLKQKGEGTMFRLLRKWLTHNIQEKHQTGQSSQNV